MINCLALKPWKGRDILSVKMDSKELLATLTAMLKYTTPHPYDIAMQAFMPPGGKYDDKGNYILSIGKSKTLFACHVDNVGKEIEETELTIEDGWIKTKPGKPCLGGDDKCGVLILLALIKYKVPGTYIFHVGEERGCIGAKYLVESGFDFKVFDRAIEFDRRDKHSIIYGMAGCKRTCSDEFVDALSKALGDELAFKGDNGGTYTDVANYIKMIPEVTNLSAGYFSEHTSSEKIDADWLVNKYIPRLLQVKWEELPTKRDCSVEESCYKQQNYGYGNHHHYDDAYDWDLYERKHGKQSGNNNSAANTGFIHQNNKSYSNDYSDNCELCDTWKRPFLDVKIAGLSFRLCEDCTSKLYNSWNDNLEDEELEEFGYNSAEVAGAISISEEEEDEEMDPNLRHMN